MAEEHEVNLYRLQAINTLIAEKQKIPPGPLMDAIDIAISDMQMIEELQAREEKIMAYVKKLDEDYKRVMSAVGSITGKVDDILSKADLANVQNQQVQENPEEVDIELSTTKYESNQINEAAKALLDKHKEEKPIKEEKPKRKITTKKATKEPSETTDEQPKKKRGRTKKEKVEETTEPKEEVKPKKRGRPKKVTE